MKLDELLTELSQRDVKLWIDGEQLGIRAPKGVLTKELRDSLVERKAEILASLHKANGRACSNLPPLFPISRDGNLPLSFAQERLWVLEQLEPGSSVYNLSVALHLKGLLDVARMEKSLAAMAQRHEILRTTFSTVDGQPIQVIVPDFALTLPLLNLREIDATQRESEVQRLASEEVQHPFDLAQRWLWRVKLLCLADDEYVFLLTMHHIISDGWSFTVFLRELTALYQAFSNDDTSIVPPTEIPLPQLPIQYADFAHWQRQWLQGEVLDSQLDYWQQQLRGNVPALTLPTHPSQPTVQTYRGARQSLVLPQTLTDDLKSLSQRETITLFTILLAAFQVLLYQYTSQEDLILCSPIAGRNQSETESLIGYFNNIVAIRTDLSGNPTFRELLSRVRRVVTEAHEHQDLPFQTLTELPNLVRTPLTRGMFAFQNAPSQALELPGITVSSLDVHNGTANFDLSLSMEEKRETLTGVMDYKTDLFDQTTITEILENFQIVLASLVANPDQHLSSLPTFTITEFPQALDHNCHSHAIKPESPKTFIAPRDQIELQLTKIWEQFLGVSSISVTDNFFNLGGHSMLAVRLFAEIEKTCGTNLPLATLLQAPTIEKLATIIRREDNASLETSEVFTLKSQSEGSSNWRSLIPIKPDGSKPPMFFIHAAGGGLLYYRNFADYLGSEQPFYGLESSGLDGKDVSHTTVEDMAVEYIKEIRSVQPEGPYFLGGLSFGGLVAFEMAQQLQAQGQKVGLIGLFDTYTPDCLIRLPFWKRLSSHWYNLFEFGVNYALKKTLGKIKWIRNRIQERLQKIVFKFYRYLGRPLPYHVRHTYVKETHYRARRRYVPQVYRGKFTLFRAKEQKLPEGYAIDPQLGWSKLAGGGLEIYDVPGNHNSMMREPHVRVLAAKLRACLDVAQSH